MATRFSQVASISSEALSQEVSGETVILDLQSEQYFGLDAVGTRIWQLLGTHKNPEMIFDVMLDEFDVEPEQLEKDMQKLFKKLAEAGLLIFEG